MKLPIVKLDLPTALLEFDIWITPSLGEIRDTERFRQELENISGLFEVMGTATNNFADEKDCTPAALADSFTKRLRGIARKEAEVTLKTLAALLFLVSGKSDNNAKCQFPIYLRNEGWESLPDIKEARGVKALVQSPIPRTLKAAQFMSIVAELGAYQDGKPQGLFDTEAYEDYRKRLLEEFIGFVLSDPGYIAQLWSIGRSYFMLKSFKKEYALLSPLVIFQVRGSVSATGGHNPEELMRQRLAQWGLQAGIDYNTKDVNVDDISGHLVIVETEDASEADEEARDTQEVSETGEENGDNQKTLRGREKRRAYDFVLPYKTPGWKPIIFVQSQFYAGDSGSVSHKNVDQTRASRNTVLGLVSTPRFIEYVDGAGYFSSLNGDLKTLLSMPTTTSFTQVRSAAIRLRRELQDIGFLVPLELEHAILRSDGNSQATRQILAEEGYSEGEIQRCHDDCIRRGLVAMSDDGKLNLTPERRDIARRYLLLDIAAKAGASPEAGTRKLTGSLMVPGYGPLHGIKLDALISEALRLAPILKLDWSDPETQMKDIVWLTEEGLAMSS